MKKKQLQRVRSGVVNGNVKNNVTRYARRPSASHLCKGRVMITAVKKCTGAYYIIRYYK